MKPQYIQIANKSTIIHSPFTGAPIDGPDEQNLDDRSLLFVYYGNLGEYTCIADRVRSALDGEADAIAPR